MRRLVPRFVLAAAFGALVVLAPACPKAGAPLRTDTGSSRDEGAGVADARVLANNEALRLALAQCEGAASPQAQAVALANIAELIEGGVGFLDVAQARAQLSARHPAWPLLTFKLARIHYHLRDWPRLEEALTSFLREAPDSPYAQSAKEMLARAARRGVVNPRAVGVLLPLTGKYGPWGEAVKRGLDLAFRGSNLQVLVKNSQGDASLAAKLVEELVLDDGAIAIIGPLGDEDSKRAALIAEELSVPLLTLTKYERITDIGPHVFRNMLTNSQQATALAEYATRTLGYKSFALLYPNIQYGVEVANDFWDAVVARGGVVRGAETYDFNQTTFTAEVKKLVGRFHLEERADYIERAREVAANAPDAFRKRKALEKVRASLPPVVDFEALLIPDRYDRVSLLAPALAVEDVITNACDPRDLERIKKSTGQSDLKTVTLLGTGTWSSPKGRSGLPELVERGGKFVNCAVYVDGFFADSERPATKRFVSQFQEAYSDVAPTLLDAIGYDAAAMLRRLIETGAPQSRDELTRQLALMRNFDGATGKTSFNDRREAVKPLFFLSVDPEGVKEFSPESKAPGT